MKGWATKARTLHALGVANIARVIAYRGGLRLGIHPVQRVTAVVPSGPFFIKSDMRPAPAAAPLHWRSEAFVFGRHRVPIVSAPPAWMVDPLADPSSQTPPIKAVTPWWRIGDFDDGDIKKLWEFSRFDWVMAFAQQVRVGDTAALIKINDWIDDWVRCNPPYLGPNWKCAQEASIRILHLSVAALIMEQEARLTPAMCALVDAHVRRIMPTLSYARAQENNHATSEAAALFVAGTWLDMAGEPRGRKLVEAGRDLLERSVARLFAPDGSFSQYSLNYHRFALDTLGLAEIWRRRAGQPPFTTRFRARAAAAAEWLRAMVDPVEGDAPNLGANDGANLLPLTDAAYRDHRPSVQLASVMFCGARAYPAGPWDDQLAWLAVTPASAPLPRPETVTFDHGGYAILRHGGAMALLRYPRFRFRPGHADALHVDFWLDGINLLRDGGSYSYNADPHWIDYFGGVRAHNTIEFDDEPQMPRLSRFLLGDWLKTEDCGSIEVPGGHGFRAAYRDRGGRRHAREVRLADSLEVIDDISGFARHAVLRWRLAPGSWVAEDGVATNGSHRLSINAPEGTTMALTEGWESRHYLEKTPTPVLEVRIAKPGRITSNYRWTT